MKKKLGVLFLLTSLLISLTQPVQAFNLLPKSKTVAIGATAYGAYLIHKSTQETLNYLRQNPEQTTDYFKQFPEKYDAVKKTLIKAINKTSDYSLYKDYKKIAQEIGLDNLPGFSGNQQAIPATYENPIVSTDINYSIPQNISTSQVPAHNIINTPSGIKINTTIEFPQENIYSWEDYIFAKSDSEALSDNIDKEEKINNPNYPKPQNVAAHHIVPANSPQAHEAREILKFAKWQKK